MCSEDTRIANESESPTAEITVGNETELNSALSTEQSLIQLTEDFEINGSTIKITYEVTINGNNHILTRGVQSKEALFIVESKGKLTLQSVVVDGNKQPGNPVGSLIQLNGGTLKLTHGVILRNNYAREGGAVYVNGSSEWSNSFIMQDDAVITGCESNTFGGGVFAAVREPETPDAIIIEGRSQLKNNGAKYGGAVAINCYESEKSAVSISHIHLRGDVILSGNQAVEGGGGLYVGNFAGKEESFRCDAPIQFKVEENVQIIDNTVEENGGGIYVLSTNPKDQVQIAKQVVLKGNRAKNGGGLYVCAANGGSDLIVEGTILLNHAEIHGGGICYKITNQGKEINNPDSDNLIHIKGADILSNYAGISGGGILCNNIVENSRAVVTFGMDGGNISNNQADNSGGGICRIGFGKFLMRLNSGVIGEQGDYEGNSAAKNSGGGIFFRCREQQEDILIEKDMRICGNYAGLHGGGIYTFDDGCVNFTLNGGEVSQNTAAGNGGGIFYQSSSENNFLKLKSGNIEHNDAYHGGGVYILNGKFEAEEQVNITENTALQNGGGIAVVTLKKGVIKGGIIEKNRARYGGGIHLKDRSIVYCTDVLVKGNEAEKGGGIYNSESYIELIDAQVKENEAEKGGGIYNNGSSVVHADFYLKGKTSISGNKSKYCGGGIYNTNAAGFVTISDKVRIMRNHAGTDGGGIYNVNNGVVGIYNEVRLGGKEKNNTAKGFGAGFYNHATLHIADMPDLTNGLFLTERDACVIIMDAIEEGLIQIDSAPYIFQLPEDQSVVIGKKGSAYQKLTDQDAKAFIKPSDGFEDWEVVLNENHSEILLMPVKEEELIEEPKEVIEEPKEVIEESKELMEEPEEWIEPPRELTEESKEDITISEAALAEDVVSGSSNKVWVYFCPHASFMFPAHNVPSALALDKGGTLTIPKVIPIRYGYQFQGWRVRGMASSPIYNPGDQIERISEDMMLCACWRMRVFPS